jgi:predicted TPR repeat methyltransferase
MQESSMLEKVFLMEGRKEVVMNSYKKNDWLQTVYKAKNHEELAVCYDAWAKTYEQDVLNYGYTYLNPVMMTGLIGRYVEPGKGTVLDAGAGTGMVGEILALMGHENIIGLDISDCMLDLAREKGVYAELRNMVLGQTLDFPDNRFIATVAMGVFTAGHAPPESFNELVRLTKPEGHIIFTIRDQVYLNKGYKEKQEALEKEGKWQLVEVTDPYQSLPLEEPDAMNQVFAYRIC